MIPTRCLIGNYYSLRKHINGGDLIAFGGLTSLSALIMKVSNSNVSHVGVISESHPYWIGGPIENAIVETTYGNNHLGLQVNFLERVLMSYDGYVWWIPLNDPNRRIVNQNYEAFYSYLMLQGANPYDIRSLVLNGLATAFPGFASEIHEYVGDDNGQRLFCSEYVARAYEAANIMLGVQSNFISPIQVCRYPIFQRDYFLLKSPEMGSDLNIEPTYRAIL